MAAKNSFVIYVDTLEILDKLDDKQTANLLRAFRYYHEKKEEELNLLLEDKILDMIFSPFLAQFKRDAVKWDETKEKRREAGRRGGLQRVANMLHNNDIEANQANASKTKQMQANANNAKQIKQRPSNDQPLTSQYQELIEDIGEEVDTPSNENGIYINNINNNINNNNYIYSEKEKEKKKKKVDYAAELAKRQQEFYDSLFPFVDEYGKALVREFYDYWSEPLQSGRKFRKETERIWDTKRRLDRWRKNNDQKQYGNKQDYDRRRAMEVTAKTSEDFMPL